MFRQDLFVLYVVCTIFARFLSAFPVFGFVLDALASVKRK